MLDANAATTSCPVALVKISSNASTTSRSEPVKPRRSMFVLSANSASTPSRPSSAKRWTSKCSPSSGVWSILKSPVWTIDADRRVNRQRDAVRHAVRDADELDRRTGRPSTRSRGRTARRRRRRRCRAPPASARRAPASAACRRPGRRRSGSTCGTPPMWSSWPCVSTSAATRRFCCRYVRSGMIRSTPSSSGSGNITPASTTIVVSPQVSASMFMPNSPSPPSGTTSSMSVHLPFGYPARDHRHQRQARISETRLRDCHD